MAANQINYSLGYNFDPALIEGISGLNSRYGNLSRVEEVFGALPDAPIASARPTSRIPYIALQEFERQLKELNKFGIAFNLLLNTAPALNNELEGKVKEYLQRLVNLGLQRVTTGTPELCSFIKSIFPSLHVTISITYGVHSNEKLRKAEVGGGDAVYLDGVFVNRNFDLLRSLINVAKTECRLYANMSCISACPVVHSHYAIFAGIQSETTVHENDAFFAGCTAVKLRNPVEWIQMPWIRPEDIPAYVSEGVKHFKLADRLAPTESLLTIARSYLRGKSPDNLFILMERDGTKYKSLSSWNEQSTPINVVSTNIPDKFIRHFKNGECISRNLSCEICSETARKAVHMNAVPTELANADPLIPYALLMRAKFTS